MMICTKCQEIYDNDYNNIQFGGLCPKKHCSGDVVWIDENMVLPCKMLWNKGYETMFTCEGHYKEWGTSPYIVFKVPIKAIIPDYYIDYASDSESDISDYAVEYYKNIVESIRFYHCNIDYDKAIAGEFQNEMSKEWWQKYSDIIIKIFNSLYCQNIINNDTFNELEIKIVEYGFVRISLYFKPMVFLLAELHPDEDCEVSELVNLHAEGDLFLTHLQYKYQYLKSLTNYIDELPTIHYIN